MLTHDQEIAVLMMLADQRIQIANLSAKNESLTAEVERLQAPEQPPDPA